MLNLIEQEIDSVIKNLNLNIDKITEFNIILQKISTEFSLDLKGRYEEIWLQLLKKNTPIFCIEDENGWKYSAEKIAHYPCFLMIDDSNNRAIYKINSPKDLNFMLEETTGFVYYLYNEKIKRILFFNFYNVLAVFESTSNP
ncbi:hypothetical protein [Neisseria sp. 83E34]|uniref:hypothetical protein n=1 Tax=Neisseria sp. 83E34 TaxID=1692264 RepID=UPI0006CEA99F|nr:hypothetical protein [Neisseria sp. 83E34]KPN71201.1 hypothetical protein AKG09_08635 [Neisseria sp. 83E34]